jgi:hypothetical protein
VAWAFWLYLRDKNIYLAGVHDFMTEFKPDFADDVIDLRELFAACDADTLNVRRRSGRG